MKMKFDEKIKKFEELKKITEELASYAIPQKYRDEKKINEYYKVLKEFQELRDEINEELNKRSAEERAARQAEPEKPKTFVNSYGEATKREITSAAYRRAEKRNNKEILTMLGRR